MEKISEAEKTEQRENNTTEQNSSFNKNTEQDNSADAGLSDQLKEEEEYIVPQLFLLS